MIFAQPVPVRTRAVIKRPIIKRKVHVLVLSELY